jgi:hypothetical protein
MGSVEWLLKGSPKQAQVEALKRSHNKRGWGHFLEMGLGKTTLAINEYLLFRKQHGYKWMVVFTYSGFVEDWQPEYERFVGEDAPPIMTFRSKEKKQALKFYKDNKDEGGVIVIHYEPMAHVSSREIIKLFMRDDTFLVLDESVLLKKHDGVYFKNILEMKTPRMVVRELSGKPAPQGPHDYWSQLRLLGALNGVNYFAFRSKYCKLGGFKGKSVVGVREENADALRELLAEWSWFAEKSDWTDLPPKNYIPVRHFEMSAAQQVAYKTMTEEFLVDLENGDLVTIDAAVAKLTKLQQIASGFIYDNEKVAHTLVEPAKNPMLKALKYDIDNIHGKAIIIAKHIPMIETLLDHFKEYNPTVIRGKKFMSREETQEQKRLFNEEDKYKLIICQTNVAKYGHTLLGTENEPCRTVMFAENSFSLDDRAQLEDRPHRYGQKYVVNYHDYSCSPVHTRAIEALVNKEDMFRFVLGLKSKDWLTL